MLDIPINKALIDSLKIRVKLDKIKVIDKRLIEDYIQYYPTIKYVDNDDVDYFNYDLRKASPLIRVINGITYRIYVKAFIGADKIAREYVVFQISAKMLKASYFEGITKDNVDLILKDLNDLNIIKISKKAFLDGLVSDIDICINSYIDDLSLGIAFSLIEQFALSGKKPLIHRFNPTVSRPLNMGLDFNKRDKATNSTPYCKIYHKGKELLSKSIDFYKAYLEPMQTDILNKLVRYEFTIKASEHKKYLISKGFKADFKTFNDLLMSKRQDLYNIAVSGIRHYTEKRVQIRSIEGLSPTEIAFKYYITNLIEYGFDTEKLLGFEYNITCPVAKSRTKSKLKKLIVEITDRNLHLKRKINKNQEVINFLKVFGLDL